MTPWGSRHITQKKSSGKQPDPDLQPGANGVSLLPPSVKGSMESAFQSDFSNVNIHTNSASATNLNALAYTQGTNIHFAPGQFNPATIQGKQLIGHELAHVVQQQNNEVAPTMQAKGYNINNDPSLEKEADESGAKAAAGQPVGLSANSIPANGIQMKCSKCEEEEKKPAQLKKNDVIQRDEPTGATGTINSTTPTTPATPAEQRDFVEMAIRYMESAHEHFQVAKITTASFERILSGWATMNTNMESIIASLSDDPLLLRWKTAYTTAIRTFFTRASAQLSKPLIRLYLENMHRIPEWAWPGTNEFPMPDDAARRTFITNFNAALNDTALFSGYTTMDQQALEYILKRLQTLVSDTELMIAQELSNNQTVNDSVRDAYADAVNTLLQRAATPMAQSRFALYMRYRYGSNQLIHWWADQRFGGIQNISTTLPTDVTPDIITGEVTFDLNGVTIIFEPDGVQTAAGAKTSGNSSFTAPGYSHRGGRVTAWNALTQPVLRIKTNYGPGLSASTTSGYGRGTTQDDKDRGNTSLGFHEGSHGRDFLRHIQNNSLPAFTGTNNMTRKQANNARTTYSAALTTYFNNMEGSSEIATDCVGTTIEDYHTAKGTVSPVTCP